MGADSIKHSPEWSDIPIRLVTICVGIPVLWIIWTQNPLRVLFFQGTHVVMAYEWTRMAFKQMDSQNKRFFTVLVPFLSVLFANVTNDSMFLAILVTYVGCLTVIMSNISSSSIIVVATIQSCLLITIPMRTWNSMTSSTDSFSFLRTVSLLLTVWNCDTGALITGRICGKKLNSESPTTISTQQQSWRKQTSLTQEVRKWLSRISPNKSMEGLLGGLVLGCATYVGLPWLWRLLFHWRLVPTHLVGTVENQSYGYQDVVVGFILSLAALVGDLWESSLKRQYSVKDSGKLLPGHGGVLDRFDSSLVAVVVYNAFYIQYIKPVRGY